MQLASAIARLERAGRDDGRSYEKLLEAALQVAEWLCAHVPEFARLPRGYEVTVVCGRRTLRVPFENSFGLLSSDLRPPREVLHRLAADIAGGFLTEVATWLEQATGANRQAALALENYDDDE